MTLEEWARTAIPETLPPLRRPPPVPLFPHQELGARRIFDLLARFGGALLLDGVGMGKSFTAAAVAREWERRGSVAVTAPAPLVATWRATLARFGVEAQLVTHDGLEALAPLEPGSLLIVDEAHRFRNIATRRYGALAGRSLAAGLLLVTATPFCNRLDDVRTIVRLAFADDVLKEHGLVSLDAAFDAARPEEIRSILALLGVRRDRADEVRFPVAERRVIRFSLGAAGERIARDIAALEVPLCGDDASPALVRSHLRARLESSPEALRDSLERQRRFYRRAREKLAAGFVLSRRDFASLFEKEEREQFQELLFPEAFLSKADPDASVVRAIERESKRIDALLRALRECLPDKFERLERVIADRDLLPAIVFTRAIATATRVAASFRPALRVGLASSRGAVDERGVGIAPSDLLRAFRLRSLDLLVLTDLASEGLDLQAAATVVHFDLPWTAVKMDQRNGRAIRIGQVRSSVRSIYFVPAASIERTRLRFVARKQREANRYLETAAFEPREGSGSAGAARVAEAAGRLVVAEGGTIFILDGGALSADPRAIRSIARADVGPLDRGALIWPAWKETARLLPSRIGRGSPAARLASIVDAETRDAVDHRFARRYRAGIEKRFDDLAEETSSDIPELLEELLRATDVLTGPAEGAARNPGTMPWPMRDSGPEIRAGE